MSLQRVLSWLQAKFKTSKFEIRPDDAQQLESDLSNLASPSFQALLFAKDFKKQCAAAEMLKDALTDCYDEVLSCLDLVLKWAVLRIVEGNTQTLISVLTMLKVCCSVALAYSRVAPGSVSVCKHSRCGQAAYSY